MIGLNRNTRNDYRTAYCQYAICGKECVKSHCSIALAAVVGLGVVARNVVGVRKLLAVFISRACCRYDLANSVSFFFNA